MLIVKLYPAEIRVLINFLRNCTGDCYRLSLTDQPLSMLVLRPYLASWNAHRLMVWRTRNPQKAYNLRMSLPVAKALYQEMLATGLTSYEQDLLARLDQAIVNYRHPLSEPYLLGDLTPIRQLFRPLSI